MASTIDSYKGKLIALTYSSIIKIGDNLNLPAVIGGTRGSPVFVNCLRSSGATPNALVNITDGDGAVSSLSLGQEHAGAKIQGPLLVCNANTPIGDASTCHILCVHNGSASIGDNFNVSGNVNVNGISQFNNNVTVDNSCGGTGLITGSIICSNSHINATGCIISQTNICSTGTNAIIKSDHLCASCTIQSDGDIIAFASSDKNLKDNIKPITNSNSIIKSLNGYEFDWKEEATKEGHSYGVIAQEVEKVMPEAVKKNSNNYLAVDYIQLIPVLIEEIKSLNNRIEILEGKK
tara:strand:- start:1594 stop:2469 length:876 start_codon:yes stop_codon:yes gene_type:complete